MNMRPASQGRLLGGRKGNVVVGTLVSFVLGFWFHPWVIGVPVFGS
jgi:hypothetical protein